MPPFFMANNKWLLACGLPVLWQAEVFACKLDVCRVFTAWRADCMNPTTLRTLANEGPQYKLCPTALAPCRKPTVGYGSLCHCSPMCLEHEFHKLSAL